MSDRAGDSIHPRLFLISVLFAMALGAATAGAADPAVERGAYIFRAGGCASCHTDRKNGGAFLAGGRALPTPFGTFYSPNITPDRETGVGAWSLADFSHALRQGVSPAGETYFPSFPYGAYTLITDGDLADLKAYLDSVAPVRRANRPHELGAPFDWRILLEPWRWLYFEEGPIQSDPARPASWNRGAYLVRALTHCGECHTPRGALGGLDGDLAFAGVRDGPEGELAPNITPHGATGIGRWSPADLVALLKTGLKPDFDNVQGLMEEAVEESYRHLSDADLKAIAEYIFSLPPIENRVEPAKKDSDDAFE